MPERKDTAGKDDERQVRGRPGPPSQSRAEKNRRPSRKGGAKTVPKIGKHDPSRGDTSGDGLH
ncbi:MAG: hypothetical protein ABW250_21470 [Pyrinomonadaceae bacterium]